MTTHKTASEQASATFVIRVYCGNCGEKWEEVAPRGTEVHSGFQGVQLHPADCTKRFGCSTYIECPNCGLEKEVRTRRGD